MHRHALILVQQQRTCWTIFFVPVLVKCTLSSASSASHTPSLRVSESSLHATCTTSSGTNTHTTHARYMHRVQRADQHPFRHPALVTVPNDSGVNQQCCLSFRVSCTDDVAAFRMPSCPAQWTAFIGSRKTIYHPWSMRCAMWSR